MLIDLTFIFPQWIRSAVQKRLRFSVSYSYMNSVVAIFPLQVGHL